MEKYELPLYEQVWRVESIIGNSIIRNLYSTSYSSKHFLGENIALFEKHLKKELLELDQRGIFTEKMNLSIKLALKN
ncbi:hypothetical protein EC501_08045 [Lysinibacillus halotolerans]|uniref:Uncharacterized protein n=1 Tax=Lysinibacillus halotolerans TaxID=1368476 RepID=A0A3M8HA20_9BACI|nr:hypothetical protein EC501_08045 [Lysinibacillus halotolerans]